MALYTYGTFAVFDPVADEVVENAAGGHLVAVKDGPPIPIYDLNDSPVSEITSNGSGQSSQFKSDTPYGLAQFGDLCVTVASNEVFQYAIDAQAAVALATSAQAAAQAAEAAVAAYIASNPGGGGIPAGTTLDSIGDSATRVAVTPAQRATVSNLVLVATTGSYTDLSNTPAAAIPASQKGTPNGVATLDVSGKLTGAQIPPNVGELNIDQAADGTWPLRNTVSADPAARVNWFTYSATSPVPLVGSGYFGPLDILWKKV